VRRIGTSEAVRTPHAIAGAEGDTGLSQRVQDAQTIMLYERAQTSTLVGVGFALLMCIGLQPFVDAGVVWSWFVLRCGVSALRLLLTRQFVRATLPSDRLWRRWLEFTFVADGFTWGLAALWLPSAATPPHVVALLLSALLGVGAIGVFVLQPSFRASAFFVASMLLPPAADYLLSGTRHGVFAGLGLAIFVALVMLEARRSEARIRELLMLRFTTDRISEERAEALRLAQRQSAVKSQFLATMSHEMRTPLHGILGLTRMLRKDGAVSPEKKPEEQLQLIERAGEHLLTLINDILDFSKLEAGQVRLSPQVFDLAGLIDDVVSLSVPGAFQSGLPLTARLHMPRPCYVRGDPSRLRQVLHNLIGNALKFTEAGAVTVVAKHRGSRARIAVHDTGVGIPAEELPRIFDAFHQADSSFTRRYGGTGLGLTIARELARAMGGDLVCTSRQGRGSCFTVTVHLPEALPPPLGAHHDKISTPLQGRVLLAEDNPVNALVAETALKNMGLTVELVEDGLQAVASFRASPPDLVLLDCQMPVMDGFEAVRRIREHEGEQGLPRTPVVALTANALQGDREQSLAAGMDDHLAKPFRDDELRAVLRRHLVPA
jgi:signal transduction histidine kinase/ActR/RegA family two-component response regulator